LRSNLRTVKSCSALLFHRHVPMWISGALRFRSAVIRQTSSQRNLYGASAFHSQERESLCSRQIGQNSRKRLDSRTARPFVTKANEVISGLGPSASKLGMDEILVSILRSIHACPTQAVFYVAGGGLQVHSFVNCSLTKFELYQVGQGQTSRFPIFSNRARAEPWRM